MERTISVSGMVRRGIVVSSADPEILFIAKAKVRAINTKPISKNKMKNVAHFNDKNLNTKSTLL
jgi:hypothetical protein